MPYVKYYKTKQKKKEKNNYGILQQEAARGDLKSDLGSHPCTVTSADYFLWFLKITEYQKCYLAAALRGATKS